MKKVLFIAVVAVASLASCKKDRTCTCTDAGGTTVVTYTKAKKGDARAACLSSTSTYGSTSYSTVCTLK
jgi:hypothetical protein